MNRISQFILDRRMARFNKKRKKTWDKMNRTIESAVAKVNSFHRSCYTGKSLAVELNWIAEIDQSTGELTRYLLRVPDSNMMHKMEYYIRAYRDTNEGVLDENVLGELERILQLF